MLGYLKAIWTVSTALPRFLDGVFEQGALANALDQVTQNERRAVLREAARGSQELETHDLPVAL